MIVQSISELKDESLKAFDCGNNELNRYLKEYALQNNKKNISRTFVFVEEEKIIGYCSLANAQIGFEIVNEKIRKSLPKYPIPAIRLARIAVSKDEQRKGIGSKLLKDAFLRILNVSKQSGIYFVLVDAKEEAQGFYEHFGFVRLSEFSSTFLLPVSTLEKAFVLSRQVL